MGQPHVGRTMAGRHWQVQAIEVVHREALKFLVAQVQPWNDLLYRTASLQSAHALGRKWNSQTADSAQPRFHPVASP